MLYFIGIIVLICGLIYKIFPPRKINSFYGYKTKLSMKNEDIWNEAQRFCAINLMILGMSFITLGFIFNYLIKYISKSYYVVFIIIGFIIMLIFDEVHLKKNF